MAPPCSPAPSLICTPPGQHPTPWQLHDMPFPTETQDFCVSATRVAEEAWHSSSVLYFEQEVVQDNHYLSTSKVARRVMSKSCTRGGKREGRMGRTDRTTERTRGFTTLHHRHLKQSSFSTCPITSHRTPLLC